MLKYVDTEITFSEVPDEISLCISISNCPHKCEGCHSEYLQEDVGKELTEEVLNRLIEENQGITCVCFMGGDNDIPTLTTLAKFVQDKELKTAWYSGLSFFPYIDRACTEYFDFIKVGPYIKELGGLKSKKTNQKFYARGKHLHKMDAGDNMFYDITDKFWEDD